MKLSTCIGAIFGSCLAWALWDVFGPQEQLAVLCLVLFVTGLLGGRIGAHVSECIRVWRIPYTQVLVVESHHVVTALKRAEKGRSSR